MSTVTELAHVARLHYRRGLTRQEIGERLGLSRFRVGRMLEEALAQGVVRIEIEDRPQDDATAAALEKAYGLDLAVVVPDAREIPDVAAGWLVQLLRPDEVLGVAWGTTLRALAEEVVPTPLGTDVVQICGAVAGLRGGSGPSEVTLRLAERLGGRAQLLPAPAWTAARSELVADPAVKPTLESFGRVTTALVGIGARPGGGHVLVYEFDRDGKLLAPELQAIALSLERLRSARVIAAAGGPRKRDAIRGALRTGLLDVLVTDLACARHALR
jgi:DNA-binding transcriptional regulator LsrR (DeoR family)